MRPEPVAVVAPWVRTRLRTAPGASCAFALLVLFTAFLAAALPRAVDVYETEGLRHDIRTAAPHTSVLEVTSPPLGLEHPQAAREAALRAAPLERHYRAITGLLPAPVRTDPAESAYGVRTSQRLEGLDGRLPKPYGLPPQFVLSTQSALDRHATLRSGRLPLARPGTSAGTTEVEAAVTARTAEALHLKAGSVVHVPASGATPLAVRITGIVDPVRPQGGYWSVEPLLRTPTYAALPASDAPRFYWQAALLLPPDAAPVLLATTGEPELYWRLAPDAGQLTAQDAPALSAAIASLSAGPELLRIREVVGATGALTTGLGTILDGYSGTRTSIAPVVAVAAFGIGAVAAVVLAMSGGLLAARRADELALLRSRGGSLAGIGGRLLAETAVVAVPAAALGLLLAVAAVGEARLLPALTGAAAVTLLACAALPLCAVHLHRRPRTHGGRDDLVAARPSRRRTVVELTVLALAAGAVVALRRRGAGDAGDHLVSAAPVLVGLIAALVLVRLYPLPLRWAARPARRLRGAVGYLSLARAGRASATGALPLLALLVALTTAAFGGSVLAGVSDARDRAAVLATGADARVTGPGEGVALPPGLAEAVRGSAGVRDLTVVQIEYGVALPAREGGSQEGRNVTLVGVEPESYARLARRTGLGAFPPAALGSTGTGGVGPPGSGRGAKDRVLPAIASPAVAERLGGDAGAIESLSGDFSVKVAAVRPRTPAVPGSDFLLVNAADLTHRAPTAVLATGPALDGAALRAAVRAEDASFTVLLRTEQREAFVDSPMQSGAERIYAAGIGAGAGYALLAVLLSLLQTSPERAALLARLRTMGLTARQGRRLLGLEAVPQALLAAVGGTLVGWATIALLSPGIDLGRLALATAAGSGGPDGVPLRADPWSLALPAAGVVVLAGVAAMGQAWWAARRGSIRELRAGDMR